jgi:putative ABC transport system permease protein
MSRRSVTGTAALVVRHLRSRASISMVLALLVLLAVALAGLLPRATVLLADAELRYQVESLAPGATDLFGTGTLGPLATADNPTTQQLFGQTDTVLSGVPRTLPAPLQDALGPVSWVALLPPDIVTLDEPRLRVQPILSLAVDIHWSDRVTLVEGAAPREWTGGGEPLEMIISEDYAELAGFRVGDLIGYFEAPLLVTGIYAPNDPDAAYWVHASELASPVVTDAPGSPTEVRGAAFIDPASAAGLPIALERSELRAWYPVSTETMVWADVSDLDDQLRRMGSLGLYLPTGEALVFGTGLPVAFDQVSASLSTAAALVALVGSAPLGALLAVLALGARSVLDRRRTSLVLASSRGASSLQLRATMLLEGALISLPAAVIATLVVAILVPVALPPESYILPAVIALAVPLLFVTSRSLGTGRGVVGARSRGRWIMEAAVLGIAGLATFLLVRRGLVVTEGVGIDPLLAATPLLLTLAVCVVVLRLFPLPLLALHRASKSGRSPVSLVGVAAAVRANTSLAPSVFAMVVAVSATVFSLVLVSTVTGGLGTAVQSQTTSDIRVSAPDLDDVDAVRAVSGVRAVAELSTVHGVELSLGADSPGVSVVFADIAALRDLRPDIPLVPAHGILVSSDIAERGRGTSSLNGYPVTIEGSVPEAGLFDLTRSWVLVDIAESSAVLGHNAHIDTLLVAVDPGVDIAATADDITTIVTAAQNSKNRDRVTVLDTSTLTSDAAARPTVAAVTFGLAAAAGLSLVLCVLAVTLEALGAASRRSRSRAILRLLGMSARQLRGVLVWEFAPVAIAALVSGTGFGIALAVLVTTLVDLRRLTGGIAVITTTVPWLLVGAAIVFCGFLVAATAAITSAGARRLDAAAAVKMGAE